MSEDGVIVVRGTSVIMASCDACGWRREPSSYHADRVAARRHAAQTGHVVRVQSQRLHYYDGRGSGSAPMSDRERQRRWGSEAA